MELLSSRLEHVEDIRRNHRLYPYTAQFNLQGSISPWPVLYVCVPILVQPCMYITRMVKGLVGMVKKLTWSAIKSKLSGTSCLAVS